MGLLLRFSLFAVSLARDNGVLLSDRSKSCMTDVELSGHPPGACVVRLLGTEINTASFAMYTFSISVFVQALVIISMSGAADHGNYRKLLLLSFAFTGAIATILFIPIVPQVYLLGGLLAIIANVCFVQHNSSDSIDSSNRFERYSQESRNRNSDSAEVEEHNLEESTEALLRHPQNTQSPVPKSVPVSPELVLSTKISSYGIGIGYLAAVIVQLLAVGIIFATRSIIGKSSTTVALRIVMGFIGLWWFCFTIPAARWLRPRPGPPIPFTRKGRQRRTWIGYVSYAWSSLLKTVLRARYLRDLMLFLGTWFLLSDGIATVSGTAVLFAKTQLGMQPAELAMINVVVTIFGITGALGWSKFSRFFNLSPAKTIIACICLFELLPIYGLLGYIPAIKRLGVIGLQQPWEMYLLGAVYGLVLGGLSSYCRSFFGELIPPGSEAAFYALYAITDKGSSIFGPAIVGSITDRYGEIRPAFVFLAVLIFIPLPLMLLVDVDRGKDDAARMAKEFGARRNSSAHHASADGTITLVDEEA
ncbi:MAG: hypothetical protein Q9190_005614 [Brigantiaea leucoxantha]